MIIGAASGLGYKYAEILLHNNAKSAVIDANIKQPECGNYFGKRI